MDVYITDLAAFLPNNPVDNSQMEEILGMVNQTPSRTRRIILRNNKIQHRYYAIDPVTGENTHSCAQLAAEAVRSLQPYPGFTPHDIACLCCGSSQPDQLMPGHASMVHGELGGSPCEVVSTAGVCVCGMTALKYAYMNVAQGLNRNAVAVGAELASSAMRARMAGTVDPDKASALEKSPALSFDADFLRWMLSDGAGAAFLTAEKPQDRDALRIDFIDIFSYANEMETCMYAGAVKNPDGSLTGWREFPSSQAMLDARALLVKQDVKLLNDNVIPLTIGRGLQDLRAKRQLQAGDIDWFLPHYSSGYFRKPLLDELERIGFPIPAERWFSNLYEKGNTGSASIYIILEELFHSGRLKKGDRILCYVPESGRFSVCYAHLTVV